MDHVMRRSINEIIEDIEYLDEICMREEAYQNIDTTQLKYDVEELVKHIELKEYRPGDVYNSPDLRRVRILLGTATEGERRAWRKKG